MAWCAPMTLGAYIRDVDSASFLLRRCVHSPGAIAGCPGEQDYCSIPNPKKQTQSKKSGRYGRFGPISGPAFLQVDFFLGPR